MSTAWLFPGQGVQHPGMSRLALGDRACRDLFAFADQLAGESVSDVSLHGPRERLREPLLAELALTVVSLANARRLRAQGQPNGVAGYSAGETAALCCAGVLTEETALEAAAIRGRVLAAFRDPESRMITVAGLEDAVASSLLEAHAGAELSVTGRNALRHFSVAGSRAIVTRFAQFARQLGALIEDVDVVGPWHTERLRPATKLVLEQLARLKFTCPRRALFMSASGFREFDPARIRQLYAMQLCTTVHWADIVERLGVEQRISTWVDVGPGRMIYGLLLRSRGKHATPTIVAAERGPRRITSKVSPLAPVTSQESQLGTT